MSEHSCTSQVEAAQLLGAWQRLQVTQLIVAEVQVGEEGDAGQSLVGQVLQGHVVQVEMCELCHGDGFFPEVSHGVVAHVQALDLAQSLQGEERKVKFSVAGPICTNN